MPIRTAATSPDRRWYIIIVLSLGMIIAYMHRSNIPVAITMPDFKALFHLSDQDRGLLNSAFFSSYAFLQLPAGWLVDRFGVKVPYALGFLFWSLVSTTMALTGSMTQLFGLYFLLGVGESVVTPASMRWIRFHFAEKERGSAIGLYMTGTKIGPAIGAPVAAFLIVNYGWRAMFLILGVGSLVWLVPWLALVKNDDRERAQAAANPGTANAQPPAAVPFGRVMASPVIWAPSSALSVTCTSSPSA